jgi:hypothetical protein
MEPRISKKLYVFVIGQLLFFKTDLSIWLVATQLVVIIAKRRILKLAMVEMLPMTRRSFRRSVGKIVTAITATNMR